MGFPALGESELTPRRDTGVRKYCDFFFSLLTLTPRCAGGYKGYISDRTVFPIFFFIIQILFFASVKMMSMEKLTSVVCFT